MLGAKVLTTAQETCKCGMWKTKENLWPSIEGVGIRIMAGGGDLLDLP